MNYAINERSLGEDEVLELAAELLSLESDEELDLFLGKVVKRVGKTAKKVFKKIGKPFGKLLKGVAKFALPLAGKFFGGMFGGPIGAQLGGQLASGVGKAMKLESANSEDEELEVAQRFVRFAESAIHHAARLPSGGATERDALRALAAAAREHTPQVFEHGALAEVSFGEEERGCRCSACPSCTDVEVFEGLESFEALEETT